MFRRLMQLAGLALAPFAALLASCVFGMLAAAPIALAYLLRGQRRRKRQKRASPARGSRQRTVLAGTTGVGQRIKL
jgi:hypothetical protein